MPPGNKSRLIRGWKKLDFSTRPPSPTSLSTHVLSCRTVSVSHFFFVFSSYRSLRMSQRHLWNNPGETGPAASQAALRGPPSPRRRADGSFVNPAYEFERGEGWSEVEDSRASTFATRYVSPHANHPAQVAARLSSMDSPGFSSPSQGAGSSSRHGALGNSRHRDPYSKGKPAPMATPEESAAFWAAHDAAERESVVARQMQNQLAASPYPSSSKGDRRRGESSRRGRGRGRRHAAERKVAPRTARYEGFPTWVVERSRIPRINPPGDDGGTDYSGDGYVDCEIYRVESSRTTTSSTSPDEQ